VRLLVDIALAHVRGRARQSVVSIAGVALGVGFSVSMAALMQGSQEEFVDTLVDAMPHVQITDERRAPPPQPAAALYDAVAFHGLRPRDDPRGILNPTAAAASLRSWAPGALSASLRLSGVARYGGAEQGVTLYGVEPMAEARVSSIDEDMTTGALTDLAGQPFGAIMGERLLDAIGAAVGDQVTLTAASGLARPFRVVGAFRTGVVAKDEGQVFVNLKAAQVLVERPNALNDIRIRLDDAQMAPLVASRAEDLLGYKAVSWQEANSQIFESFRVRSVIMYTVVGAILLVAGFGIFNIVSIITHEKARDVAILKSLGFQTGDVTRIFVLEGLAMGAAGAALGCALGYGLTALMGSLTFEIATSVEVTHLPVVYDTRHYAIACAVALGAAAVAGWLPARKAARANPVDIIRGAT
jgi:lipoprotein-releasing system permease protein